MEKKKYLSPQMMVIQQTMMSGILVASDTITVDPNSEVNPGGAESRFHLWEDYEEEEI